MWLRKGVALPHLRKDIHFDSVVHWERFGLSCYLIQSLLGSVQGASHPYYSHRKGVPYACKFYMEIMQGEDSLYSGILSH